MRSPTESLNLERHESIPGRELALIALVLALGLVLRMWAFGSTSLDHYDEGAYGLSAIGVGDFRTGVTLFPGQYKFSPPVYFTLVGLTAGGLGLPVAPIALLLNIALGTLTIAAVWWLGRRWFGAGVGVGAAVLLACNEYHIGLSRSALTDVSFALFFILALIALEEAMRRGTLGAAIAAGLAVGLAWNIKYHGWFAGVIAVGALVCWALFRRRLRILVERPGAILLVAAAVACLTYVPWAWYIHTQPGGYREFAVYQSTMLRGNWWGNLALHAELQRFFEGPWTRAAPLGAVAAMAAMGSGPNIRQARLVAVLGLAGVVLLGGGTPVVMALGIVCLPWMLRRCPTYCTWMLVVWVAVFVVMTPFYRPYARLLLPLLIASQLAAAWALGRAMIALTNGPGTGRVALRPPAVLAVGIVVALLAWWIVPDVSSPWRAAPTMRAAVFSMLPSIPMGSRVVVFGEPAVSVYLEDAGRSASERIEDPRLLDTLRTPTFIVTGRYARAVPTTRDALAMFADRLDTLGTFPVLPKDIRLLDDMRPSVVRKLLETATAPISGGYQLELFQLRPSLAGRPSAMALEPPDVR